MLNRRQFMIGSSAVASFATLAAGCKSQWSPTAYRRATKSSVAVLPAPSYTASLAAIIKQGIKISGLNPQGKRVVLKPNMVEYDPQGVINTHPAVVAGAIDAFKSSGAREVVVAEGPGHRRDTEYLLTASGLYDVVKTLKTSFVDLNQDNVRQHALRSSYTDLKQVFFPSSVLDADLLVSMPKMKTHHWVGVTLSLKNMFGLMPGAVYGWPKNVLHWAGIENSILDINSSLPMPQFAIVDGVVAMEGNGPIQGQAKNMGVLVFGQDMVAVDATASRLMGMQPERISYLAEAGKFLGNMRSEAIQQVGEPIAKFSQSFNVLPAFEHLKIGTA